jgi:hypothetical protein
VQELGVFGEGEGELGGVAAEGAEMFVDFGAWDGFYWGVWWGVGALVRWCGGFKRLRVIRF